MAATGVALAYKAKFDDFDAQQAETFAKNVQNVLLEKQTTTKLNNKEKKALDIIGGKKSAKRTKRLVKIHRQYQHDFGFSEADAIDPDKIKQFIQKIVEFINALMPLLMLLGLV